MNEGDVMKFLGRDVWTFIFGKQISKLRTDNKGQLKILIIIGTFIIDVDELKFHCFLFSNKNPSLEETKNLENIIVIVAGIIKGVLGTFNNDCTVNYSLKPQPLINTLTNGNPQINEFAYSFTIMLLNTNNNR